MKVVDSNDIYKAFFDMAKKESEWLDEASYDLDGATKDTALLALAGISGAAKLVSELLYEPGEDDV